MSVGWVAAGVGAVGILAGNSASKRAQNSSNAALAAQQEATAAQEAAAMRQVALQEQQFSYFKDRQVGIDATAEEVTRRELAMAEEVSAQGRDIYNYQKDVFRPVEQSLVSQAMRESTPEFYEQYAQQAMATQAGANANAQGQSDRILASMGVNPNSGAYQSQQRGLQLANAANMGAVSNDARDRSEALGWARKAEIAGLGKGLVGAGNASYGLATAANTAASNATNNANSQAIAGQGTATQYGQLGMQGLNGVTNSYGDIYRTTSAQHQAANASISQGMGLAGNALGSIYKSYNTP